MRVLPKHALARGPRATLRDRTKSGTDPHDARFGPDHAPITDEIFSMLSRTSSGVALHRGATLLAFATLFLIFVGGLVTSTGSGLAVPDWPLSFGQFFPPMVGGVFYEHGHRLVAATVGLSTVMLASWVLLMERRPVVRRLAAAAVATVVAQGLLGGVTVLLLLPPAVSVAHACVAQAFLCITVALAVVTRPGWEATPLPVSRGADGPGLASLTALTAAAVYVQLLLGAIMRHTGAGLAIPDFPLAFGRLVPPLATPGVAIHFAHRLGAVGVTLMIAWTAAHILRSSSRTPALVGWSVLAALLVAVQLTLGAAIVWTRKAVLPTTAHVAVGAAILACTIVLALHARRLVPTGRRISSGVLDPARVPV